MVVPRGTLQRKKDRLGDNLGTNKCVKDPSSKIQEAYTSSLFLPLNRLGSTRTSWHNTSWSKNSQPYFTRTSPSTGAIVILLYPYLDQSLKREARADAHKTNNKMKTYKEEYWYFFQATASPFGGPPADRNEAYSTIHGYFAKANKVDNTQLLDHLEPKPDAGELVHVNADMLSNARASRGAAHSEMISAHKAFFIPFELAPLLLGKGLAPHQAMGILYSPSESPLISGDLSEPGLTMYMKNKVLHRDLPSLNRSPIPSGDPVLTAAVSKALTDHQLKLSEELDQNRPSTHLSSLQKSKHEKTHMIFQSQVAARANELWIQPPFVTQTRFRVISESRAYLGRTPLVYCLRCYRDSPLITTGYGKQKVTKKKKPPLFTARRRKKTGVVVSPGLRDHIVNDASCYSYFTQSSGIVDFASCIFIRKKRKKLEDVSQQLGLTNTRNGPQSSDGALPELLDNQVMYDPSVESIGRALIGQELSNIEDDDDSVSEDNFFFPNNDDEEEGSEIIEAPHSSIVNDEEGINIDVDDSHRASNTLLITTPNVGRNISDELKVKIKLMKIMRNHSIPLVAEKELYEWAIESERLNLFSWTKGNLIKTRA
eukprot:jgi/Psemu1/5628/gm1.5628_g